MVCQHRRLILDCFHFILVSVPDALGPVPLTVQGDILLHSDLFYLALEDIVTFSFVEETNLSISIVSPFMQTQEESADAILEPDNECYVRIGYCRVRFGRLRGRGRARHIWLNNFEFNLDFEVRLEVLFFAGVIDATMLLGFAHFCFDGLVGFLDMVRGAFFV